MIDWDEKKLNEYINNKIEENQHLEYKSAKALEKLEKKKTDISITISSMANADGGIVIYGIKEYDDTDKRHLPEKIDPINRQEFSKEWLEQIINSNIYPAIQNVLIYSVNIEADPKNVVYVVEVPKSFTAHQAKDLKYYRRYNFSANPMFDYEIRDILNRFQTPKLTLEFKIETETHEIKSGDYLPGLTFGLQEERKKEKEFVTYTALKVFCYNKGKVLATYVHCYISIPLQFYKTEKKGNRETIIKEGVNYVDELCDNTVRELIGHSGTFPYSVPNYGSARYKPILPNTKNRIDSIELINDLNYGDSKLYWTIHADNAEPMTGECYLKDIEIIDVSKKEE
jgi:hypothetical protein